MFTAKEARVKVLQKITEDEEFKSLIGLINKDIEHSVEQGYLKTIITVDRIIPCMLIDALKIYYEDLGYIFNYVQNIALNTFRIGISWDLKEDRYL